MIRGRVEKKIHVVDKIHRIIILILMRYGKKPNKNNLTYKLIRFIFHKIMGKGTLIHIKFDVTERCNKKCSYCYSGKRNIEPSFDDIRNFFSQFKGRIFRIDIMGGEPMLRKDIYLILKCAKDIGGVSLVTMFTNGTLINEEAASKLKQSGLDVAFVSFYSDNPYLQDRLCSSPGTFEAKILAIKELVRAGIKTYSFTVINKDNVGNIESIDKLVRSFGARVVFFNQIPMNKRDIDCQLSAKELSKVKETLKRISPQHMNSVYNTFKFFGHSCFGGYFMLSVKVDGAVTHCPFVYDVILGNAFKDDIFKLFKKRFSVDEFNNIYIAPDDCLSCCIVNYCRGGCKAGNKTSLGKYNSRPSYCLGPWHSKDTANKIEHIPYWF